ncbi:hypothetical protein HG530_009030 [Fusarium avenaceum]|nr:hypothetical protein HG530_009030 [Fusarium avenaceum]
MRLVGKRDLSAIVLTIRRLKGGAKLIVEPSASEATIFVSGTGRLENFTAEDCLERFGLPGAEVPPRYGRTVSSRVGLAGRTRENAVQVPEESRETREGNASPTDAMLPLRERWSVCFAEDSEAS